MNFARLTISAIAIAAAITPTVGFEADFDFSNVRACAGGALRITPSPEFRLGDVPDGTVALDFRLVDLTIGFEHGGRKLAYAGQETIPADSFKYIGPCPTSGTHNYEWTIRALDAADGELGVTTAQGEFTASR